MTYGLLLRRPGSTPVKALFAADTDADALSVASETAKGADASVWMLWETLDGKARQLDVRGL